MYLNIIMFILYINIYNLLILILRKLEEIAKFVKLLFNIIYEFYYEIFPKNLKIY